MNFNTSFNLSFLRVLAVLTFQIYCSSSYGAPGGKASERLSSNWIQSEEDSKDEVCFGEGRSETFLSCSFDVLEEMQKNIRNIRSNIIKIQTAYIVGQKRVSQREDSSWSLESNLAIFQSQAASTIQDLNLQDPDKTILFLQRYFYKILLRMELAIAKIYEDDESLSLQTWMDTAQLRFSNSQHAKNPYPLTQGYIDLRQLLQEYRAFQFVVAGYNKLNSNFVKN